MHTMALRLRPSALFSLCLNQLKHQGAIDLNLTSFSCFRGGRIQTPPGYFKIKPMIICIKSVIVVLSYSRWSQQNRSVSGAVFCSFFPFLSVPAEALDFTSQMMHTSQRSGIIVLLPHLLLMLQALIYPACFRLAQILFSTVALHRNKDLIKA